VVPVPDERLEKLAKLSRSKKTIPAVVEFYDIAGLVRGAYKGEGLGNQFLARIRDTQAIIVILRIFKNPEVVHVENSVDPLRDFEILNIELAMKDAETVEKRLASVEQEIKSKKKGAIEERDLLLRTKKTLESGLPIISDRVLYSDILKNIGIKNLNLLTAKEQIYLLNGRPEEATAELKDKIKTINASYLIVDLSAPEQESINALIKEAYKILDLISFFTTGEDETRAWTIKRGTRAPQAAGVIHTDFENKFICAEVINWQKLLDAGGPSTGSGANAWAQAKQKGLIQLEGKNYVVQDGDVLVVRHG
jgi:hypothetical protein